jgi:hypothetical protein
MIILEQSDKLNNMLIKELIIIVIDYAADFNSSLST